MSNDVPRDLQGVYVSNVANYRGKAVGGPEDGNEFSWHCLTRFLPRTISTSSLGRGFVPQLGASPEQREEQRRVEKQILEATLRARNNPHRYDFDVKEKIWRYVEYDPGEV